MWTVGSSPPLVEIEPLSLAAVLVILAAPVELVTVGAEGGGRVAKEAVEAAQVPPAEFAAKHL